MNITYRYKLKLTKQQQQRVDSWLGTCRLVYNMALDLKIQAYQKNIPLSFYDLQKQLPDLKRDIDWIEDVPAKSLQAVIQKLEYSFKGLFEKRAGFPKFKSKKHSNSILIKTDKRFKDVRQISETSFRIPKIGVVKVFKDRVAVGEITSATICKEVNQYYLSVCCDGERPQLTPNENQVGIDVGIANFATLSDGSFVEHPKITFKYQAELRRQQRKLSRCKLRSKNWYKQVLVVQKLYQKIRRSRLDFLHKISSDIVKYNGFISVENLNIKGMIRGRLSKYIADSGWYTFKQLLKYKSEMYGRVFIEVNPAYSSQECNACGHVAAENRQSQSIFVCVQCGHADNADLNASKNLLRRGHRLLAQSTDNSLRLAKELVA